MAKKRNRPDMDGKHRGQFEINKKKIRATETVCAICGKPIDLSLKFPHPLSSSIDHVIPVSKGGHPSDIANLQHAHLQCNRLKAAKLAYPQGQNDPATDAVNNRRLPHSIDWVEWIQKNR